MSLDIAVVLAHLSGRVLVPYHFRIPRRVPWAAKSGRAFQPLSLVPELYEIPVAWSDEYLEEKRPPLPEGAVTCEWAALYDSVFYLAPDAPADENVFRQFRNGRLHAYTFDALQSDAADLHVKSETLGFYSHFFYLDTARRAEVIGLMKRLRPKQPYRQLADRISTGLGRFNSIHVRRGDFVSMRFTPRAARVSGQEIVANLADRMSRNVPLVICTDGSPQEEIFGPIQRHFREPIFFDSYLAEEPSLRRALDELPNNDELVVALLTQLVASQAEVFAGTLFSTLTALIHRLRGFASREPNFLYCYNDFDAPFVRFEKGEFLPVDDGPFSWNRTRYPVAPYAYSWFREWPEAFDATAPRPSPAAESGTMHLSAAEAVVHGETARYMDDEAAQDMIGYWTSAEDRVSWTVCSEAPRSYWVEIRFACADDSRGSRYRIGVEGGDALEARVWNTGGWTALSPWLALGRIRVPAGKSTLMLRVIDKPRHAVMNLSGVRLVPVERTR